jgi:hypothetical protein
MNRSHRAMTAHPRAFKSIGRGSLSTVYQPTGDPTCVWKYEHNAPTDSILLQKEFEAHQDIYDAMRMARSTIWDDVPIPYTFIKGSDQRWRARNLWDFPETPLPRDMLVAERIRPLDETCWSYFIDTHRPKAIRQAFFDSPSNMDCLVRVYLGRDRDAQA